MNAIRMVNAAAKKCAKTLNANRHARNAELVPNVFAYQIIELCANAQRSVKYD